MQVKKLVGQWDVRSMSDKLMVFEN